MAFKALARAGRHRTGARRRVASVAILMLVIGGWFLWLRPTTLGGPLSFVTVSGTSMQPTMYTGDLAVVYRRGAFSAGDVIEYRVQTPSGGRSVVIHRIVGGNERDGFVTQGDNNDWPDPWRPTPSDIVGVMAFHLPDVGSVLSFVGRPVNLACLLGGITAFFILMGSDKGKHRKKTIDRPPGDSESDCRDSDATASSTNSL